MGRQVKIYTGRVASTVLLGISLFLCSISAYIILGASSSISAMVGAVNISVEVLDTAKIETDVITNALNEIAGINSVRYIENTTAEREFSEFIGSDITKYTGQGVLPSTFILEVEASHSLLDSLQSIKLEIAEQSWVGEVFYQSAVAEQSIENLTAIEQFASYMMWIFGLCTVLLGYLSTRMSIGALCNAYGVARYREIFRSAIGWALVQGLLSAVIAVALLYFTVSYFQITLAHLEFTSTTLPIIASGIVVLAILAAVIFTLISIVTQKLR